MSAIAKQIDALTDRIAALEEALTVAASRMEVASADWSIASTLNSDKLSHADAMEQWAKEARAVLAIPHDPGSAPVEGWRLGAETMRDRYVKVCDSIANDGPPTLTEGASFCARVIHALPLHPPPAEPSRDAQEGERS